MIRLWIADVHANLAAFEAVLRDAGTVDEIVFLGDIVSYGPHPSQCVDLLMRLDARAIIGNHDLHVLDRSGRDITPVTPVTNWEDWTYLQLSQRQLAYLSSLPKTLEITCCGAEATILHHSPVSFYLHPSMPDEMLAECFGALAGDMFICGHSHKQIDRCVNGRRIICIPPVGQSRNGDPRAGYALETDNELQFHYVEYDVERVADDVRRIGFPAAYCERFVRFLCTGYDEEWSREQW